MSSNTNNKLEEVKEVVLTFKRNGDSLEEIREKLKNIIDIQILNEVIDDLKKIQEDIVHIEIPLSIKDESLPTWYPGPRDSDLFWSCYKKILLEVKKFPISVIDSIDSATSKIVAYLQDPNENRFNLKGLVVGYVQSGKTANYTGVIAKAADTGYKMFIILTSSNKKLRIQTQKRIEEDLINYNKQRWALLTSQDHDFRKDIPNPDYYLSKGRDEDGKKKKDDQRTICVVKKYPSRLENLLNFLNKATPEVLNDTAVLLIDDEADQASINTGNPDDRSRINSLIIEILEKLNKVAYMGYTATPFANVLVDPHYSDDLYPRDFIFDLPRPEKYFGVEKIFGRERLQFEETGEPIEGGLDIIRLVSLDEIEQLKPNKENKDIFFPTLTESLKQAVKYFWLATAVRYFREKEPRHSTMLIHTTSFITPQNRFLNPLINFREEYLNKITDPSSNQDTLDELKIIWEEEQQNLDPESLDPPLEPVSFEQLKPFLQNIIRSTEVFIENSTTKRDERLIYSDEPGIYIVVGGNTLSRGLTLEGLIVSYFIRYASAYDTLLQMGRWFGFRIGYEDLPRIWMTEELKSYFFDLAAVEEEIRYDIQRYMKENLSPLEFGVRIRSHPILLITSRLKMKGVKECNVSYSEKRVQTILFKTKNEEWLEDNIKTAINLIKGIKSPLKKGNEFSFFPNVYGFEKVDVQQIIKFLEEYQFHENSPHLNNFLLIQYIKDEVNCNSLKSWNVLILSRKYDENLGKINLGLPNGEEINLISRSQASFSDNSANLKSIMLREDTIIDFKDKSGIDTKKDDLFKYRTKNKPETGLLIIYPISKDSKAPISKVTNPNQDLNAIEHVIGVGIVFPKSKRNIPDTYVVANIPEPIGIEIEEEIIEIDDNE